MAAGTYPLYCWSVDIVAGVNDSIVVSVDDGPDQIVTLSPGTFWARGAVNVSDDLFKNIQDSLEQAVPGGRWRHNFDPQARWLGENRIPEDTVTRGTSGQMEIVTSQKLMIRSSLYPNNGFTFDPQEMGFSQSADPDHLADGAQHILISPYNVKRTWVPGEIFVFDSENYFEGRSSGAVCMDGVTTRTVRWGTRALRDTRHDILPPRAIFQAEETRLFTSVQRFHSHYSKGSDFEFHPDMSLLDEFVPHGTSWGRYVMGMENRDEWPATTPISTARLYEVEFAMLRVGERSYP